MNKKWFGSLMVFFFALVFTATVFAANYKPEYKMSIVVGPTGPWGESAARFAEAVKKAAREGLDGSTAAFDTLKKNGMEVTVLTPAQIKVFQDKTKSVYDKWSKEIGIELVKAAEKDIQKAAGTK